MHSLCTGAGSSGSADFVPMKYDPSEYAADELIELQTAMSAADTPERPETPGSSGSADFVPMKYDPSEYATDELIELRTAMSAADMPERPETPQRARMEDGQPDGPDGAERTRIEDCQLPNTPETWNDGQPDGPDLVPDTVPDNDSDVPSDDSDDKSDFHMLVLHCNLFHMQRSQTMLTLGGPGGRISKRLRSY